MVTWEIDVTIPDFMFKTAFTSAQGVATLIDAIFITMDSYMEVALENNKNLTRATLSLINYTLLNRVENITY